MAIDVMSVVSQRASQRAKSKSKRGRKAREEEMKAKVMKVLEIGLAAECDLVCKNTRAHMFIHMLTQPMLERHTRAQCMPKMCLKSTYLQQSFAPRTSHPRCLDQSYQTCPHSKAWPRDSSSTRSSCTPDRSSAGAVQTNGN